jgi:hypothetical protein
VRRIRLVGPDEDELKEALTIIGCQLDADEDDRFGQDCVDAYKKLRTMLAPHLRFDLGD